MIIGLIVIAFLISFWFYKKTVPQLQSWQKWLLLLLRTLAFSVALILLFNPIIKYSKDRQLRPKVLLLTDTSASMQQKMGNSTIASLAETAKRLLSQELAMAQYEIIERDFADGLNGEPDNTLLGKSLRSFQKEEGLENLQEIYLFSDGWFKDENLKFLEYFNIPINSFIQNFSSSDFDLHISNVKFPSTGYKNEIIPLLAQVEAEKYTGKASVQLVIDGKLKSTRDIDFKNQKYRQLSFENVFSESGLHRLEIKITADSLDEINFENNSLPASILIRENKLKCLIVSDKLTWDESFIIKSLAGDEHWETSYLNKKGKFYLRNHNADFAEELTDANCLIFINHGSLRINPPQADLIRNFVAKGSGFIFFGEQINNLASILPSQQVILNGSFQGQIRFNKESTKYSTFRWQNENIPLNIPPVDYYFVKPKLQAKILATFDNEQQNPAILFSTYESGKVMHFPFLNLWKWQMWEEGNHYKTFMHNLINWFGQQDANRIVAETDRISYLEGEPVKVLLQIFTEQFNPANEVNALLKLYNENKELIKEDYFTAFQDKYQIVLNDLMPGNYLYEIYDSVSGLATSSEFVVQNYNSEMFDKGINDVLLGFISKTTGGKAFSSINDLKIDVAEHITQRIQFEIPLYKKWFLIAAFLLSFCLELFFRKRWGLL